MKDITLDRELDFMLKYNLDANEFLVCILIFYAQEDHDEYLSKYFTESSVMDLKSILHSLQEKGIILKKYIVPERGTEFNAKDVPLNQNVIKDILKHSQQMGMEVFQSYPPYVIINGKTFSLRNITKLHKSLDDFCFAYGKSINFDPKKHQEVLELLEWAKSNNLIHNGICEFVGSQQWELFKSMKDEGISVFDTMEEI